MLIKNLTISILIFCFSMLVNANEIDPLYPTHEILEGSSTQQWPYPLPFMAQDVLDMGFELPHPFGISILYAHVNQELELSNLNVGFGSNSKNNLDEYVKLDNAFAINDTVQIKADAWIFPFMNVFAYIGAIDGTANLDIGLDFGASDGDICNPSGPKPPPDICANLGGKTFHIDNINYTGYNIGIGTILAAGWEEWFLAIPISYTWSDINIMKTVVETINITPRLGYSFNMKKLGNIYPFIGATYLDVDMIIEGEILSNDGTTLIDYDLRQVNKDKWNALLGYNWDFSKKWSWNLEAGFLGSRSDVITGVTYRY